MSVTSFFILALGRASACSYFEVNTSLPLGKIMGHTMEFGTMGSLTDSYLKVTPRRTKLQVTNGSCSTSSFGTLGFLGIEFSTLLSDGMNEAGLIISTQSLYRSEYQKCDPCNASYTTIFTARFPNWILSRYKTVEAVKRALTSDSYCVMNPFPMKSTNTHWQIADSAGNSIVVEYINGKPQIHENYVGLMTNDPPYLWQVENINTYSWLTADSQVRSGPLMVDISDQLPGTHSVPKNWGHGFNLGGLPGDPSPPSRFVRMFYARQVTQLNSKPSDLNGWLSVVQGILNMIFIPKGLTGPDTSKLLESDHTSWATMRIPSTGFYAFRSYENMQWHVVDLKKLSWTKSASFKVDSNIAESFKDITADVQSRQAASSLLTPRFLMDAKDSV